MMSAWKRHIQMRKTPELDTECSHGGLKMTMLSHAANHDSSSPSFLELCFCSFVSVDCLVVYLKLCRLTRRLVVGFCIFWVRDYQFRTPHPPSRVHMSINIVHTKPLKQTSLSPSSAHPWTMIDFWTFWCLYCSGWGRWVLVSYNFCWIISITSISIDHIKSWNFEYSAIQLH